MCNIDLLHVPNSVHKWCNLSTITFVPDNFFVTCCNDKLLDTIVGVLTPSNRKR